MRTPQKHLLQLKCSLAIVNVNGHCALENLKGNKLCMMMPFIKCANLQLGLEHFGGRKNSCCGVCETSVSSSSLLARLCPSPSLTHHSSSSSFPSMPPSTSYRSSCTSSSSCRFVVHPIIVCHRNGVQCASCEVRGHPMA